MDRRGFLGWLGALAAAPFLPQLPAAGPAGDILYWVAVRCANPFVFGVRADREVAGLGPNVLPGRHSSPEAARSVLCA